MGETELPRVISPGTQIVTLIATDGVAGGSARPRGAVGAVSAAPSDELGLYRVRFADGGEAAYMYSNSCIRRWCCAPARSTRN